jgi:hypothetical protein
MIPYHGKSLVDIPSNFGASLCKSSNNSVVSKIGFGYNFR